MSALAFCFYFSDPLRFGRERVIASSDCGISSFASVESEIHPTVVWAKFQSMAEGARLASQQLWGR